MHKTKVCSFFTELYQLSNLHTLFDKPQATPAKRRPQTPFTADESNIALYGGMTLVALATVLGIILRRREN